MGSEKKMKKATDTKVKVNAGFTLIELLVVVVVIGILAAFAVIGYNAVMKGTRNNLQMPRLSQYAEAQNKFRTVLGKRRYATFAELCAEGLLIDSVARVNPTTCAQTAINGWTITPGEESAAFLRNNFFAVLNFETRPPGDTTPAACVGADGVLRRADATAPGTCTAASAPYLP